MLTLHTRQHLLKIHDLLDLRQKPAVDLAQVKYLINRKSRAQGVPDEKDPLGVGRAQFADNDLARQNVAVAINLGADAPGLAVAAQTAAPDFQ